MSEKLDDFPLQTFVLVSRNYYAKTGIPWMKPKSFSSIPYHTFTILSGFGLPWKVVPAKTKQFVPTKTNILQRLAGFFYR